MRSRDKEVRSMKAEVRYFALHTSSFVLLIVLFLIPTTLFAQSLQSLTYRYNHHLFVINPADHPAWRTTQEVWHYQGQPIAAAQHLRVDGDNIPPLPEGITRSLQYAWNQEAIEATLQAKIATVLNRPRGEVTVSKEGDAITFEGVGFLGQTVDTAHLARLTITALDTGITDIHIPIQEQQPVMHVLHPELQDMGIKEVVAIGESDFSGSPLARRHNIATGLTKFNGHVVPQGEIFSFNKTLGPVNQATGYKKELVILGNKTLPDYGGGLCQISTTAYRGIWQYGFPIEQRKNHSFAVQYYAPQGTDATIYPPAVDIKFRNDSPGALLIQTHREGDKAYFIYYGTRDHRKTEIIGPYVWDRRPAPPDKVEYSTELPPGETKSVGKAVPGMHAAWFRVLRNGATGDEVIEPVYSFYEARPNYTLIGSVVEPTIEEVEASAQRRQERLQRAGR